MEGTYFFCEHFSCLLNANQAEELVTIQDLRNYLLDVEEICDNNSSP